ncbi:hypothetical protein DXG01_013195, partial [Tephrocybe rancida]
SYHVADHSSSIRAARNHPSSFVLSRNSAVSRGVFAVISVTGEYDRQELPTDPPPADVVSDLIDPDIWLFDEKMNSVGTADGDFESEDDEHFLSPGAYGRGNFRCSSSQTPKTSSSAPISAPLNSLRPRVELTRDRCMERSPLRTSVTYASVKRPPSHLSLLHRPANLLPLVTSRRKRRTLGLSAKTPPRYPSPPQPLP